MITRILRIYFNLNVWFILENCSLQWKTITGDKIPENAVIGGFGVDSKPLYICRHKQNDQLIPGKAIDKQGCVVTLDGKVYTFTSDYEVLVGPNSNIWVQRHGGDAVPETAFIAGQNKAGQHIYVGRCNMHMGNAVSEVVGRIDHKFYYAQGDKEHSDCENHKILIC